MSVTLPVPSQRGHMPPVTVKLASHGLAGAALDGERTDSLGSRGC